MEKGEAMRRQFAARVTNQDVVDFDDEWPVDEWGVRIVARRMIDGGAGCEVAEQATRDLASF